MWLPAHQMALITPNGILFALTIASLFQDLASLEAAVDSQTKVVSIGLASNATGRIHMPAGAIERRCPHAR